MGLLHGASKKTIWNVNNFVPSGDVDGLPREAKVLVEAWWHHYWKTWIVIARRLVDPSSLTSLNYFQWMTCQHGQVTLMLSALIQTRPFKAHMMLGLRTILGCNFLIHLKCAYSFGRKHSIGLQLSSGIVMSGSLKLKTMFLSGAYYMDYLMKITKPFFIKGTSSCCMLSLFFLMLWQATIVVSGTNRSPQLSRRSHSMNMSFQW